MADRVLTACACLLAILLFCCLLLRRDSAVEAFAADEVALPCDKPRPDSIDANTVLQPAGDLRDVPATLSAHFNTCAARQSLFDDGSHKIIRTPVTVTDDAHRFRFMDRQFVSCDGVNGVLNGLQYELSGTSLGATAVCQLQQPRVACSKTQRTNFHTEALGPIGHRADCFDNAMTGVGFESDAAGNVRVRYDCAADVHVDPATRKQYYTGWKDYDPNGDIMQAFSEHVVKCPDGTALTSIAGRRCLAGGVSKLTAEFACAAIDQDASAAMRARCVRENGPRADAVRPPRSNRADVAGGRKAHEKILGDVLDPVKHTIENVAGVVDSVRHVASGVYGSVSHVLSDLRAHGLSMRETGDVIGHGVTSALKGAGQFVNRVDESIAGIADNSVKKIGDSIGTVGSVFNTLSTHSIDVVHGAVVNLKTTLDSVISNVRTVRSAASKWQFLFNSYWGELTDTLFNQLTGDKPMLPSLAVSDKEFSELDPTMPN